MVIDNMKTIFRPYRSTLAETIADGFEVTSIADLVEKLNAKDGLRKFTPNEIKIEWYAVDRRINEDCWIVTVPGYGVLGFTNYNLDQI
jgi:hypothetical protein